MLTLCHNTFENGWKMMVFYLAVIYEQLVDYINWIISLSDKKVPQGFCHNVWDPKLRKEKTVIAHLREGWQRLFLFLGKMLKELVVGNRLDVFYILHLSFLSLLKKQLLLTLSSEQLLQVYLTFNFKQTRIDLIFYTFSCQNWLEFINVLIFP